jgi:capsular exopolysaccharide synthesis family protein
VTQYDFNLRDCWRILRRRGWLVAVVTVIMTLSTLVLTLLLAPRPIYRATAAVRFERAVNVSGLLLSDVLNISPVGDMETQVALITSFPVVGRAAVKLGLIPAEATPSAILASARYQDTVSDLAGRLLVERSAGTSLIEISATSSVPVDAARVANSVAEAFRDENIAARTQQIVEARQFIETQLMEVGQRLRQSEEQMKMFQEVDQRLSLPEELRAASGRRALQEAENDRIKKEISTVETQLRLVEEGRSGNRLAAFSADGDAALAKLQGSLNELSVERQDLLLTLLPTHPQVKGVEARIANVRASLVQALSSKLQLLRALAAESQNTLASVRARQAALPGVALEATRLERDVKVNERIFSLLKERLQEALIKEKERGAEVTVVRPAVAPTVPVNSVQPFTRAQFGLLVGLLLGLILAFLVEALDNSIGAIDEVESLMETRVLGVIPALDPKLDLAEPGELASPDDVGRHPFLTSLFAPKARLAEAFRSLRTNVIFATLERDLKIILVTGGSQMEGKTTVALNLAITLAQLGKKTLLVEADLRRPYIRHALGLAKTPGLSEAVLGSVSLDGATLGIAELMMGKAGMERLLDSPGMDHFFVLPSGYPPSNPSELLSSQGLVKVLTEARAKYDYVILDSSPILPVPDAAILASRADVTLLVIRVGHMPRVALRRAKALLDATSTRLLGVCLSGVRPDLSSDYAEMASYGYRYGTQAESATSAKPRPARGPLASRWRVLRWGAAIGLALLVVTTGAWRWRAGRPVVPHASSDIGRPAPASAHPPMPPIREASRPAVFTVRLSDPAGEMGRERGTVSIGRFETPTEAEAYGGELVRTGVITSFAVVPLSPSDQ